VASPAPITQLWASIADLDEGGPPPEVLASKPIRHKLRALRAATSVLLTYVRSRYAAPLLASLTRVEAKQYATPLEASYVTDELELSTLGSGSIAIVGDPTEATSIAVRATASGPAAGLAVAWSHDAGFTWSPADVGTLDGSGSIDLGENGAGLSVVFSGLIEEGAAIFIEAGVEEACRSAAESVAAYKLVYNRGVDPNAPEGKALRQLYDDAIAWAKAVQSEQAKLDEKRDATPGKRETRPRGSGQKDPWDFLDGC